MNIAAVAYPIFNFLCSKDAEAAPASTTAIFGLLDVWYQFPEVKQNWFGFTLGSNRGRGLGRDFALALHKNLHHLFHDFGREQITKGSHLEKLCLIREGVGRDNVSDFTTNLIKGFFANTPRSSRGST